MKAFYVCATFSAAALLAAPSGVLASSPSQCVENPKKKEILPYDPTSISGTLDSPCHSEWIPIYNLPGMAQPGYVCGDSTTSSNQGLGDYCKGAWQALCPNPWGYDESSEWTKKNVKCVPYEKVYHDGLTVPRYLYRCEWKGAREEPSLCNPSAPAQWSARSLRK